MFSDKPKQHTLQKSSSLIDIPCKIHVHHLRLACKFVVISIYRPAKKVSTLVLRHPAGSVGYLGEVTYRR